MAQELAAKHRVFIHAGSIMERIEGDERIHNTTVVFNREGEEIARYRKIHLFDVTTPDGASYKESATVKAGDLVVTYDCEGVTVGCAICYDLRFPGLFQALADKGARSDRAARRLHPADRQGPLGSAAARPRDRDRDLCLRERADGNFHRQQRDAARPTAIRWSPTPGGSSSPRRPTASASSRRGSTWRRSSACGSMIPVAQHRVDFAAAEPEPTQKCVARRAIIRLLRQGLRSNSARARPRAPGESPWRKTNSTSPRSPTTNSSADARRPLRRPEGGDRGGRAHPARRAAGRPTTC